ncbi:O-antigen ligase [mine drainage metagenome]|uniref:O-antigen ligase n=1 Tax=mine drainage metagenome TaxID=410659 RepID=A0A1J5R1X1_9ZZZZ
MRIEREPAAIGLGGAALIGFVWLMPWPLASNREWAVGAWLVLLVPLVLVELWRDGGLFADRWNPGVPHGMRAHMALLLVWIACLALQLLPLPAVLRDPVQLAVAPALPAKQGFAPLTIDRYVTLAYLVKAVWLLLFQWLLLRRFDNRPRLVRLVWAWLAIGGVEALLGVILYASASSYRVFFVDVEQGLRASGTFVYHNHFAGYMELMLALGIGWMISLLGQDANADRRQGAVSWLYATLRFLSSSKAPLRALLVVLVVGLIASRSRMGNAAFFVALWGVGGATLLALHRHGAVHRRVSRAVAILMVSILVIDIVIIGNVVGISKVMRRIEATHISNRPSAGRVRPRAHREESIDQRIAPGIAALSIWRDHPWFGSGGGTFFLAFLPYRPENVVGFYDHAHDDFVEFLVEVGVIGAVPLIALLLWSQWRGWRLLLGRNTTGFERGLAFASVMGVTELLIHASVDFNLQNPTNAAMFLWLLGLPHWIEARRQRKCTPTQGGGAERLFCNNRPI